MGYCQSKTAAETPTCGEIVKAKYTGTEASKLNPESNGQDSDK